MERSQRPSPETAATCGARTFAPTITSSTNAAAPPPGIAIDPDVDLTRPLPYGSAAFDLVILCEVAEHLPTYIPVIAEIGRVLAPSGRLVLSTPNVARLHSRWHFFWTGTHKLIRRRVGWDLAPDDLYAYHITPVDFPLLHTLLRQAGLSVERLDVTRFKWKHAWLFLLYPFIWLSTRLETRRHRSGPGHAAGEEDLFRWMTRPAMLGSEQLLLTARKRAGQVSNFRSRPIPTTSEKTRPDPPPSPYRGGTRAPADTIIFMACSGVISR